MEYLILNTEDTDLLTVFYVTADMLGVEMDTNWNDDSYFNPWDHQLVRPICQIYIDCARLAFFTFCDDEPGAITLTWENLEENLEKALKLQKLI